MDPIEITRRKRLSILIKEVGSQAELSNRIGKAPAQISQWVRGLPDSKTGKPRVMSREIAREIEKLLGLEPGWMDQPIQANSESEPAVSSGKLIQSHPAIPVYHAADAVIVPVLANCGSMGPGADLLESDVIVGDLALSPHWINQYIRPQNPRELRFIHAYGDSMSPTFTDGDVLLVDTGPGARDPHTREGVYVLQADGKNYVKRVTPTFDGKLQVTSDNPSSKTVQVLNGDHQVDVVGRVVWAWNGKRL
ncbi:S24 family peptidase [Comamonas sp. w2-DMI]|uniref:LexA family transcriptional regulator n=1 Tax=Comamonas sp. w2-DMI TaxID=3126391 RepID=UPI0032E5049A